MAWYQRISKQTKSSVKTAAYDYKNQDTFLDESVGDVQRYVLDSYVIKLFKSKTSKKISISLTGSHNYLGSVQFSFFFASALNEDAKATQVIKELDKLVKNTCHDFIEEERPTNLLFGFLKKEIQKKYRDYFVKTNIPSINFSYDLPVEADWRLSIYGTRYPGYSEKSFKQNYNKNGE